MKLKGLKDWGYAKDESEEHEHAEGIDLKRTSVSDSLALHASFLKSIQNNHWSNLLDAALIVCIFAALSVICLYGVWKFRTM